MAQQSDVLQAYLTRFEPEPEKTEEETPEEEEE